MSEIHAVPVDIIKLVVTLQDNPMGGLILTVLVAVVVIGLMALRTSKGHSPAEPKGRKR